MTDMTVDIIIPVYRPDLRLKKLIERLKRQTHPVNRIIIINTGKEYFDSVFTGDEDFLKGVKIRHIYKEQFDHGTTRRMAAAMSDADIFICMTDDALPLDRFLVERLVKPIEEGKAQAAYARQLAGKNADISEKFSRRFNYPPVSCIKSAADLHTLGIKTFFCSNACAAYDKKTYTAAGGFEKDMIFNEDMVYARHLIDSGGSIAYVAEARVLHSHSYTPLQQFRRNFDLGVSQAQYPDVFGGISSSSEGIRMMRGMTGYLVRRRLFRLLIPVLAGAAAKLAGYRLGKLYKKLPRLLIKAFTMNKGYWRFI